MLPEALAAAREQVLHGDPRDAMLALDDAVRVAPEDAEVQLLRGECALRMGVEDQNPLMFADARNAFLAAARTGAAPVAWLGAARAGWLSYYATSDVKELTDALAHAKTGVARLGPTPRYAEYLSWDLERTYAEVAFAAYTESKSGYLPALNAEALFEETRAALEAVLGKAPTDPWAWNQLANLYQWEGRGDDARDVLERALAIAPADVALHDNLVRVTSTTGGWQATLDFYERFSADHPALAVGPWNQARATYELALARLLDAQGGRQDQSIAFQDAEALFRAARELDESYTDACLGYEVICRDGLGASLFYAGELDMAADAFFSMEELFPGGLRWEVRDKLWSGVRWLEFLLYEHNCAWTDKWGENVEVPAWARGLHGFADRFPHLEKAAALAERLYAFDPENSGYAHDAGSFLLDLGASYEEQAEPLLADKDAPAGAAAALLRKAHATMERSYAAFRRAAELAPDDARVQNDAGLVLTHHLQRDYDVAEAYHRRAIALGQPQLDAGLEDEAQRAYVSEAVGDAHYNLAFLALTAHGDAATAKVEFELSLGFVRSTDSETRTRRHFLPLCDLMLAGEVPVALVQRAYYWQDLDPERVLDRMQAETELIERVDAR